MEPENRTTDSLFRHALRPLSWDEIEALPLADEQTGGCPNCGGRHYTAVHPILRHAPCCYRCKGTKWPNADDYEYQEACGALFRGRPNVHYDESYFAAMTVMEFLHRFGQEGDLAA